LKAKSNQAAANFELGHSGSKQASTQLMMAFYVPAMPMKNVLIALRLDLSPGLECGTK